MFTRQRGIPILAVIASLAVELLAQSHSGFPVDIASGPIPQPVMAKNRTYLVYELHVTNYLPLPTEFTRLEILADGSTSLASYSGKTLEDMVIPAERLSSPKSPSQYVGSRIIGEGHTAIVFVDLALNPDVRLPQQLNHRFTFSVTPKGKPTSERTLNGPAVSVSTVPTPVLHPPLHGSAWVAFNALGGKDHRRSLNAVDGKERIAQRFAIDWMRLGPDGRLFHASDKSNANFYGYGAEVLAVADARVSDVKDGLPENNGVTELSGRSITLDTPFGNYVMLDLGDGRFAAYAHLQPGSLKVKIGEHVKTGQVLALLGNSGNSDAPHLHFQLVDANSPLASEGIPFEFEIFTELGVVRDDSDPQSNGGVLLEDSEHKPVVRTHEFPMNNAAVTFP